MLQRGRQILVMAPEIALAQALVDRFAAMIKSDQQPVAIHLWHGGMSPANRAEVWAAVQSRKPLVLIGGAVSLPCSHAKSWLDNRG